METRGILERARELFERNPRPTWTEFYRAVFAPGGLIDEIYPASDRTQFEQTEACHQLHKWLQELRARDQQLAGPVPRDPQRVITLRLPKSVHEALKAESERHGESMNQLLLSKALVPLVEILKLHQPPSLPTPNP